MAEFTTIVLVGPKHSGKTSTGLALAALLEGDFTDLDSFIKERTGKSPRTLYREGPEIFKKAEAEALSALLSCRTEKSSLTVIAIGGGIIDNSEALSLLTGRDPPPLLIYLAVSAGTAWERIESAAAKTGELPPFLNTANPRETHRELHERRSAAYQKLAGIRVKCEGKTPEQLATEIAAALKAPNHEIL
jgi:shikimate kinase